FPGTPALPTHRRIAVRHGVRGRSGQNYFLHFVPTRLTARAYMKSLVIAEKPSVAADLARALGKVPKKGDHYENDEYVISYALGHLVELEMPEDIDKKKYGFWRLETLPIIPDKFG